MLSFAFSSPIAWAEDGTRSKPEAADISQDRFADPMILEAISASKIVVYLFYGEGCPHCEATEPFIDSLAAKYPQTTFTKLEIWNNQANYQLFKDFNADFGITETAVPSVFIENEAALVGPDAIKADLESIIKRLINEMNADPPGAPRNLVAAAGNGNIVLSWSVPASDGGSTITGYKIWWGTTSGALSLLTTTGKVLTYTKTGLTNGQNYYFKVSAVNAAGEGALSSEVYATPATVPTAPQSATAVRGDGQVTLTWSVPASNGGSPVTSYKVYRGTVSGGEALIAALGNLLNYTDAGLTNGQTYYYQVSALNSVGEGTRSQEVSATPLGLPSSPTLASATPGNGYVVLAWSAPPSTGGSPITGYNVYRGTTPNGEALIAEAGNILIYNSTGLINGIAYYFKVSAVSSVGESALSNEFSATPAMQPSAPTLGSAMPGDERSILAWSAPLNDGGSPVTGYRVYRGTVPGNETILSTLENVLTFTDTGLTNGVTYYYRVSALNAIGEGPRSGGVSAIPATVPSAPLNLVALGSVGQIVLTWQVPEDDGYSPITGYEIFRATASGGQDAGLIATTDATTLTYSDTEPVADVYYVYTVRAVNAIGESAPSDVESTFSVSAQVPSALTGFSAVAYDGYVILNWNVSANDGGAAITHYNIYRSATPGGNYSLIASPNALTFADTGLTNGQAYHYKACAVNAIGEGPLTEELKATPSAPAAGGGCLVIMALAAVGVCLIFVGRRK